MDLKNVPPIQWGQMKFSSNRKSSSSISGEGKFSVAFWIEVKSNINKNQSSKKSF